MLTLTGRKATKRARRPGLLWVVTIAVASTLAPSVTHPAAAGSTATAPRIVFTSNRDSSWPNPGSDVYLMDLDGSNVTRLTYAQQTDEDFAGQPSWSPDGQRIAYASDVAQKYYPDIYVMNNDGSGQARLTTTGGSAPAWSPDGTELAYAGGAGGVYVMNRDGSGQTLLTPGDSSAGEPAWSPDGSRIVFQTARAGDSSGPGYNPELYVMNADGSSPTRLTVTDAAVIDEWPAWSPDGTRIVFDRLSYAGQANSEIMVMNADGTGATALTNDTDLESNPSWSPDGTKIIFNQTFPSFPDDQPNRLWVMNADGTGKTPFTNSYHDFQAKFQPYTDVAVTLSASPMRPKVNKPLTYTITVLAQGPSAALDVVVTDALPVGETFVSATPSSGTCTGPAPGQTGTVSCSLGYVRAATTAVAQVQVRVLQKRAEVTNSVTATTATLEFDLSDNTATVSSTVK